MLNRIKDNTFIKSTLILLIGGLFGKVIGFILKIIITRKLGTHSMGLFSLLSPTSSLLSVLSVFYYSNAISKMISEGHKDIKGIFISIIPISVLINFIFIYITLLISNYLSFELSDSNILKYPIICISLTMPFISFSSIIKGYFWGKQNMGPYMLSNFIEQVVRLILVILFIDYFKSISTTSVLCFVILINVIGEISSEITMLLFIPNINIKLSDLKINITYIKEILSFCIPSTTSKLIGSISYFLEPIILTRFLLLNSYSSDYIIYEYGIINAYALSTLLMPQFFTQNMSTSLIPELSKNYSNKNIELCIKRIKQIIMLSLLIGSISTLIIAIFPSLILNILYKTNEGIDYIRLLSPFTILFYIEYPLVESLQALGKTKKVLKITMITSTIRIISIIIFSFLKIGMYSFILSIVINLICSTYLYYKEVKNTLLIT